MSYLDNLSIPVLFAYPGRDHLVKPEYARDFAAQLKAKGNPTVWLEVPWPEHAFDEVFWGLSNRLILRYTEVFLAWALEGNKPK